MHAAETPALFRRSGGLLRVARGYVAGLRSYSRIASIPVAGARRAGIARRTISPTFPLAAASEGRYLPFQSHPMLTNQRAFRSATR